jgi:hypothetical protein
MLFPTIYSSSTIIIRALGGEDGPDSVEFSRLGRSRAVVIYYKLHLKVNDDESLERCMICCNRSKPSIIKMVFATINLLVGIFVFRLIVIRSDSSRYRSRHSTRLPIRKLPPNAVMFLPLKSKRVLR